MSVLVHLHHLFNAAQGQTYIYTLIRCGGKIIHRNVLAARATTLAAGALTAIPPGEQTLLVS